MHNNYYYQTFANEIKKIKLNNMKVIERIFKGLIGIPCITIVVLAVIILDTILYIPYYIITGSDSLFENHPSIIGQLVTSAVEKIRKCFKF